MGSGTEFGTLRRASISINGSRETWCEEKSLQLGGKGEWADLDGATVYEPQRGPQEVRLSFGIRLADTGGIDYAGLLISQEAVNARWATAGAAYEILGRVTSFNENDPGAGAGHKATVEIVGRILNRTVY